MSTPQSPSPQFCSNCGKPVRPNTMFCTSCGQPLTAQPPAQATPTPAAPAIPAVPNAPAAGASPVSPNSASTAKKHYSARTWVLCGTVALVLIAAIAVLVGHTWLQHEHDTAYQACEQYNTQRHEKIDALSKKLDVYKDTDFLRYRNSNSTYGSMAVGNLNSNIGQMRDNFEIFCSTNDTTDQLRSQLSQEHNNEDNLDKGIAEIESLIPHIDTMKEMQATAGNYNMPSCTSIAGNYKYRRHLDKKDFANTVIDDSCGLRFVQYTNTALDDLEAAFSGDIDSMIGDSRPSRTLHLDSIEEVSHDFGSKEWKASDGDVTACVVAAAPGVPIDTEYYPYQSMGLGFDGLEDLEYMRISMTTECDSPSSASIYYKSKDDTDAFLKERISDSSKSLDTVYDKAHKICEANAGTYTAKDGTTITLRKDCTTLRMMDDDNTPQMVPFDATSFISPMDGTYMWGTTGEGPPIIKIVDKDAKEGFRDVQERTEDARISPFIMQMPTSQREYDEGILVKQ